jgi:hypothetical protein
MGLFDLRELDLHFGKSLGWNGELAERQTGTPFQRILKRRESNTTVIKHN